MHKRTKLLFITLGAIIAYTLPAASASANRSIQVTGGPRVQAEGRVQFIGTEGSAALEIACDITILRTITSVVPKIRGTQFGKVTGIQIDRGELTRARHCRHGSFVREGHDIVPLINPRTECRHSETGNGILRWDCSGAPASLWTLIYDSFQGTLPRIEGVNVHIAGEQINFKLLEPFGGTVECLYEGNIFGLVAVRPEGLITSASAVRALTQLTRISGSAICPARGSFEGSFNVRPGLNIRLV